jgi:hypothetical protein
MFNVVVFSAKTENPNDKFSCLLFSFFVQMISTTEVNANGMKQIAMSLSIKPLYYHLRTAPPSLFSATALFI